MKIRRALLLFGGGIKRLLNLANLFSFEADHTTPTAGVLPVYKPYGGLGDFTVVRGSSATYVDSGGIIKEAFQLGDELVTNGDFEDGSTGWTLQNATIQNGYATISSPSTAYISQDMLTVGKTYQVDYEIFIRTGTALIGENLDYAVTISTPGATSGTQIFTVNAQTLFVCRGNNVDFDVHNISVKEVSYDIARIDYTNGVAELLTEPQSTNLITYSEDFSNASWLKYEGATIDYGVAISPDGTQNASRLTLGDTVSSRIQTNISISATPTDYTFSTYLRVESGSTSVRIGFSSTNAAFYKEVTVTTEWQRFDYSRDLDTNVYAQIANGGVAPKDILVWGADLEPLPYATSYIPTNGSTVTRLQDVITDGANVNVINSEEGTMFFEGSALVDTLSGRITISSGSGVNRILMFYENQNSITVLMDASSSRLFTTSVPVTDSLENIKFAIKFKSGDSAIWLNGVEVFTSSTAFTNGVMDVINFADSLGTNQPLFGRTRALKCYDRALTDEELEQITTL